MDSSHLTYSEITEHLIVGTNLCCEDHFGKLLALGVRADIDLEKERGTFERPEGMESYLWLPVEDHRAPTLEQLEAGVGLIEAFVRAGKKVYVHCKNGHGRGPTLAAAYFIAQGVGAKEAVDAVKARRPEIHLEDNQFAVLRKFASKHV